MKATLQSLVGWPHGASGCGSVLAYGIGICLLSATCASAEAVQRAVPDLARPLPLTAVRLTGGPLKNAQDLDAKYLLDLQPDRMLAFLRIRAGLEGKAEGYGGWDGGRGKQLTGHIAGHYLSGVSYMYAATGDPRYKERADYIVAQLKVIQDKQGDGYIGAITDNQGTDGKVLFQQVAAGNIRSGGFDLNGLWSPWYVEHKVPAEVVKDRQKVTVRFAATNGNQIGTVCGVRVIRADAER